METERIHNLTKQGCSMQRTSFLHNGNSFSQKALSEPDTKELFDKHPSSNSALRGDYLKSSLPSIPPKKRKKIQEELQMSNEFTDETLEKGGLNEEDSNFCPTKEVLCGSTQSENKLEDGTDAVFTVESLDKSDPNEDTAFCPKVLSESLCENPSEELTECEIEFNLQSSVHVRADDSAEWINLKCFESITSDRSNSAMFFAGGPIQCSAFSMMHQYIAVAVSNAIYNKHSYNNTENVNGIIQFWNFGLLNERKTLNQSPSMELALYHDNGIITQMKWCPADCFDDICPSTFNVPKLGLLATSSSNSNVYIYSVPQPNCMPKSRSTFPIYFTAPSLTLIPLFDGPSNTTRKAMATCLEWGKNGELIASGYGNGSVCVWRLKVSSFTSCIAVKKAKQSYIIQPYLFFQPSGAPITSLSFAPFNNDRWLAVTSIDKTIRFFDLCDTAAPFYIAKQVWENSCIWSDVFCGVYSSPAVNVPSGLISLFPKDCCAVSNDKGAQKKLFDYSTLVAVSEKKNFHAMADMAGTVIVNFLKNIDKPLETYYLTHIIFETEVMALDSSELNNYENKISISGNFHSKTKQGSSSSSSGFCSSKLGKTQCSDDNTVILPRSSSESSMNDVRDTKKCGRKILLNSPLHSEDTNDKTINFESEVMALDSIDVELNTSECKIGISKNIPHNNATSDANGTLHTKLKQGSSSSGFFSPNLGRTLCSEDSAINLPRSSSDSSSINDVKDTNNNEIEILLDAPSHFEEETNDEMKKCSKDTADLMREILKMKMKSEESTSHILPFKTSNNFSCDSKGAKRLSDGALITSPASSDYTGDTIIYPIKPLFWDTSHPIKSEDTLSQNLDTKGNFKKDVIKLPSHESFDNPLSDGLEMNNSNQPQLLPDICSSITSNNYIICDKDAQPVSDRALIQSSAASDYSGDTIIYSPESHDCNKADENYFKMEKPVATFQSLYKSEKGNTFQKTLLHKVGEKEKPGSNPKLSLNCNSEEMDFSMSGFQLLPSKYVHEENHAGLSKNSQDLLYENLITKYGVIYKNNFEKSRNLRKCQEHDIHIEHNPLCVINTISCGPNDFLFVGANSGIGRLVPVSDLADKEKELQTKRKRKRS